MSTTRFIPRRPFSSAVRVLQQESSRSASAHLFQQADKEEQLREEGRPQGRESSVPDKDAWTGEERVQDAVLRMLVSSPHESMWRPTFMSVADRQLQTFARRRLEAQARNPTTH